MTTEIVRNESKGRKNVWGNWLTLAVLALTAASTEAQRRPPVIGRHLPDPGPNRIEVRFAIGEKAVECKRFRITARVEGRDIMAGKYASGFEIPADAMTLPRKDALNLEFKCGHNRWHFSKVPETAFQPGWWWVGTDYPPFQETFQGWPDFRDAAWIHYLTVDPQGFIVERHCPAKLKDQKPGPCYED